MTDYRNLYHGLDRAAWGYLFLYFNINIGNVSWLPTFVGYLLFLSAIGLMEDEERELSLLRPLGMLLAVWHGLDWFLSFLGRDLYGLSPFLDLIQTLVNLYFHFQLMTNLATLATRLQPEDQEIDRTLLKYRTIQTIMITGLHIISGFSGWFGEFWTILSGSMGVAYVIAGIALMRTLFRFRNVFKGKAITE